MGWVKAPPKNQETLLGQVLHVRTQLTSPGLNFCQLEIKGGAIIILNLFHLYTLQFSFDS